MKLCYPTNHNGSIFAISENNNIVELGNVLPPVRIAIQNGMLRAWRNVSTVLFFR